MVIHLITILIMLSVCNSHANKPNSIDPKCSDTTSSSNIESVDTSRLNLVSNDPRISFSGKTLLYRPNVFIEYTAYKPDFCVKYDLIANDSDINGASICFKYNMNINESQGYHGVGLGTSGPQKEFDLSTISFTTELSDSSFEIGIQYGISRKKSQENVKIILQFDRNGMKTLSRIPESYREKIHILDCKKSRFKCVNTYDF
jgi:hypothetical protein